VSVHDLPRGPIPLNSTFVDIQLLTCTPGAKTIRQEIFFEMRSEQTHGFQLVALPCVQNLFRLPALGGKGHTYGMQNGSQSGKCFSHLRTTMVDHILTSTFGEAKTPTK
jgi:hypothetical protein